MNPLLRGQWAVAIRHLGGIFYRALAHALSAALLGMLAILLNPFDLNSWSDSRSRAIWQQLYAPLYPAETRSGASFSLPDPPAAQDRIGLNRITTLVFDDGSGVTTGGIRANNLINLITQMAVEPRSADATRPVLAKPRAIFFDFAPSSQAIPSGWTPRATAGPVPCGNSTDTDAQLAACLLDKVAAVTRYADWPADRQCQNNPLEKLRCIKAAGGVPIMFGHIGPVADVTPGSLAHWLDQLGLLVNIADLNENGQLALVDATAEQAMNRRWSITPPAALYLADCVARMAEHCRPLAGMLAGRSATLPALFDAPILPVAGLRPHTSRARLLEDIEGGTEAQRCITADAVHAAPLKFLAPAVLPDLFAADERPLCPYNDRLRVQTLSLAAGTIRHQIHQNLLAERLVLVGDDRRASTDRHDLPPFKRLAGVHLLAMATDNLLEHPQEPPRPLNRLAETGLTGLSVFVISLVVWNLKLLFAEPPAGWPLWPLLLLLILGSGALMWGALAWTPPLRLNGLKTVLVLLFLIGSLTELYLSVLVTGIKARMFGRKTA